MGQIVGPDGRIHLGALKLAVTQGQRNPEEWGALLADRIVSVGPNVPNPIRDQAQAFKDDIAKKCGNYIRMAIECERVYLAAELERLGMTEAAAMVKERK